MNEKFDANRLGPREVPIYEKDRVPHATWKLLDDLHTTALLHRSVYAGDFYQYRQAGPGMERGILTFPVEMLHGVGDHLRRFAFIEKACPQNDNRSKAFHITFDTREKKTLMEFLRERVGEAFTYQIVNAPYRTMSQGEKKAAAQALRKSSKSNKGPRGIATSCELQLDSTYAAQLMEAIDRNDEKFIENKVKELGKMVINSSLDARGTTLLHYACLMHKHLCVKFLLDMKASTKSKNEDGKTPQDMLDIKKDDVNEDEKSISKHLLLGSCIVEAAKQKAYAYVKYCIEELNYDINATNMFGMNCLHYTAKAQAVDISMFLIEKGIDIYKENRNGSRSIDECKTEAFRDQLEKAYENRPCTKQGKSPQKKLKQSRNSSTKVLYWGYQESTDRLNAADETKKATRFLPEITDGNFSTWYEGKFRGWSTYASQACRYDLNAEKEKSARRK